MLKKLLLCCIVSLFCTACTFAQEEIPESGLTSITARELYDHVAFLASDQLMGRDTPSAGLDTAAAYIARDFTSNGLLSPETIEEYFHYLPLQRLSLAAANSLSVFNEEIRQEFQIKNDFVPLDFSGNGKIEAEIVFAGYGITAEEYGYDDYATIDAAGKIVLVLSNEPQEKDSSSVFDGAQNTRYSRLAYKVENAVAHGAAGFLYVRNPVNYRFRRPPNTWPSLMRRQPSGGSKLPVRYVGSKTEEITAMTLGRDCAEFLVEHTGKNLSEWQTHIDSTLRPQSFVIPQLRAAIEVNLAQEVVPAKNVVGIIPGSDPQLKDELVIIGAHYDHVGVSGDQIYNGADDNASGTAGIMEIAEAFASCAQRPLRTVLFIAFAGEEKGLFGSRWYVDAPAYPLDKTVAMLNLDMISRNDSNEVAIIGAKTSVALAALNERANGEIGLELDYGEDRYFINSDHYPFYRARIPVLFYNSKDHHDLHQPGDDVEKIIPEKMEKICKLIFSTAWLVANQRERPDFVENAY